MQQVNQCTSCGELGESVSDVALIVLLRARLHLIVNASASSEPEIIVGASWDSTHVPQGDTIDARLQSWLKHGASGHDRSSL